jgi:hypothetical protein
MMILDFRMLILDFLDNTDTKFSIMDTTLEKIKLDHNISKKMTHSELGKLLEQAEKYFKNGDFYTTEEVRLLMKDWKQ